METGKISILHSVLNLEETTCALEQSHTQAIAVLRLMTELGSGMDSIQTVGSRMHRVLNTLPSRDNVLPGPRLSNGLEFLEHHMAPDNH